MQIAVFGESVMYKPHKDAGRMHQAESKWRDGIWLGFSTRTGEHIVSDDGGVVSCRAIHRRPPEQMWGKELALKVVGTLGASKAATQWWATTWRSDVASSR